MLFSDGFIHLFGALLISKIDLLLLFDLFVGFVGN